jgi:hypothetical protein
LRESWIPFHLKPPQVLSPDTSNSLPTWSWNLPNDAVEFRYQINGEQEDAWILAVDSIRTYTPPENLPEGIHTLYVQCRDKAGNWSSSGSASVVILYESILDTIPPEAPQVLSPDTSYSLPTWSWNLPDDAVEFRYQINGEKEDAWILVKDSIRTYTPPENLPEGIHTLYVQCRDKEGNWSSSGSASVVVLYWYPLVIKHPAELAVNLSHPDRPLQHVDITRSATFIVSVQGDDITYQWYRNNEKIDSATSAQYHILEASMDDSGDVIFCVVQNSFGSDTSNPAILHVYAPNAPQVTAPGDYSTVWTWNLPEGAVEFRYQLDSTNNDKWTTVKKTVRSYTLPKNVSGTHTLFVQCRGERGG